mgnify:CR=1 FL=1
MNSGSEKKLSMDELLEKNRPAQMVQTTPQPPAQELTPPPEVHPTKAEWEDLQSDLYTLGYHTERQTGYLKKVNELLQHLEERRVAAKREADELVGQAKNTRDQADSYAASKREEADIQAAAIVHKAGEEADAQIEERRAAAQSELDGLSKRIADLQERESVITQRVSELRSMFSQAFSGFAFGGNAAASGQDQEAAAAAALPVVAPVPEVKPVHNEADDQPGELSGNESAADDHNETDAAPADSADSADSAAQNEQSESSEPSEHQTQGEPEAPTQENPAVSEQNGE